MQAILRLKEVTINYTKHNDYTKDTGVNWDCPGQVGTCGHSWKMG